MMFHLNVQEDNYDV